MSKRLDCGGDERGGCLSFPQEISIEATADTVDQLRLVHEVVQLLLRKPWEAIQNPLVQRLPQGGAGEIGRLCWLGWLLVWFISRHR